jgi:hypothetical protein
MAKNRTLIQVSPPALQIMINNNEVDFHLQALPQINLTNSYIMLGVDQYQIQLVQLPKTNEHKSIKSPRIPPLFINRMAATQTLMHINTALIMCSLQAKINQMARYHWVSRNLKI